jgi:hypothetical protein
MSSCMDFHLNTHTIHGFNLRLFHLARASRRHSNSVVSRLNNFTVKMICAERVTDFDDFHSRQEFSRGRLLARTHGMLSNILLARLSGQALVISLALVTASTTLPEVHINIKGLSCLLRNYDLHPKSTIHRILPCSSTEGSRKEEVVIPVSTF